VPLSEAHDAGGFDEGRCKPQGADDDAADEPPNVEPAIDWDATGAPWFCMRGGYHHL